MSADPRAPYRAFVDAMVTLARSSVVARRIETKGHAERWNEADLPLDPAEARRKALFLAMSADQRQAVASLLEEERTAAIHDVLAYLDGAVAGDEWVVSVDGRSLKDMPDETMHGDFVSRTEGYDWYAER